MKRYTRLALAEREEISLCVPGNWPSMDGSGRMSTLGWLIAGCRSRLPSS